MTSKLRQVFLAIFEIVRLSILILCQAGIRLIRIEEAHTVKTANEHTRIAIIGGGIAGHGCAYSLNSSNGFDVHLFEERSDFGGNAKTFDWPDGAVTGLSVLAWPAAYFRNYKALLKALNVSTENVSLPFCIRSVNGMYFAHDKAMGLSRRYGNDIYCWNKMIWLVHCINRFFNGTDEASLYHMSMLNPMNIIPLRILSRLFFVSDEFWQDVIVPLYASSFLTVHLDGVPAVILPTLNSLIPLTSSPSMESWVASSRDVFDRMASAKGSADSTLTRHPEHSVFSVYQNPHSRKWSIVTSSGTYSDFDRVVFASNAHHATRTLGNGFSRIARWILAAVTYTDEWDASFITGIIHSDSTVLPVAHRNELLDNYANYIESRIEEGQVRYTNTFILSSWMPSLQHEKGLYSIGRCTPRLVTYGAQSPESIQNKCGEVRNIKNHPHLSLVGLLLTMGLRYIQGERGVYFCGSFATPGNGHDLSLCSGFAVADALGASYPFSDEADAKRDYNRLKRIMGL
mmetsp:Transcript_15863/g.23888  ORF Transcript_15863/g.23888 Transcript_15863/m.23888 type:complete len:514 (+) Transcript_15863:33-1574(+)